MDLLFAVTLAVAALVTFDLAAVGWGVDSRDTVGDDHAR
jgi:hypothetical protein